MPDRGGRHRRCMVVGHLIRVDPPRSRYRQQKPDQQVLTLSVFALICYTPIARVGCFEAL